MVWYVYVMYAYATNKRKIFPNKKLKTSKWHRKPVKITKISKYEKKKPTPPQGYVLVSSFPTSLLGVVFWNEPFLVTLFQNIFFQNQDLIHPQTHLHFAPNLWNSLSLKWSWEKWVLVIVSWNERTLRSFCQNMFHISHNFINMMIYGLILSFSRILYKRT
jgi:hypothetical protein